MDIGITAQDRKEIAQGLSLIHILPRHPPSPQHKGASKMLHKVPIAEFFYYIEEIACKA